MKVENVESFFDCARNQGRKWNLSVAAPHDASVLSTISMLCAGGVANARLFGAEKKIREICDGEHIDIDAAMQIIETKGDFAAAASAAAYLKEGDGDVLVKGQLPTSTLIKAILSIDKGIRHDRLLSHVALFNDPKSGRLMLLSDAGVNISPNVYRKVRIVQNAVRVAQKLGIEKPKVALLAAIDKLNYPAMQATLDAALVSKIASDGVVNNAFVEGPFALDNAVCLDSARKKGITGNVAGLADILIAPEIETANVLYKALQFFGDVTYASVVVGATWPMAVPSRVDSSSTKLMSISLACLLAQ